MSEDARTADGREWWPSFHDVVRWLVRGGVPNTEANMLRALTAIDAHEQGVSTGEWAEELRRRAELATNVQGVEAETADQQTARLEARLAQLEALLKAQTATPPPPAAPAQPVEAAPSA